MENKSLSRSLVVGYEYCYTEFRSSDMLYVKIDDQKINIYSLNEEDERTVNHTTIPQLHLLFNPVIETKDQLNRVLTIIQMIYPNLKWVSNKLISEYNPFDSEMDAGEVIEGLNITKEDGSYKGGKMTYNCLVDLGDSSTPPHMDGWEWIQKHTSDTNQIFNSLYDN